MHDVVFLSQLAAPDVIHQPPQEDPASVPSSPFFTTLVPDNVDISIPLVSSPTTVTNLGISYRSLSLINSVNSPMIILLSRLNFSNLMLISRHSRWSRLRSRQLLINRNFQSVIFT